MQDRTSDGGTLLHLSKIAATCARFGRAQTGKTEVVPSGLCALLGRRAEPRTAPNFSALCALQGRHDLAREQVDGAAHLRQREVTERELPDEVIGAGFLHLRLDHARDGGRRAGDAAPAVLDLVE